jgi:N6-adenosine-specific RNA methylase IME4
VSGIYRTIVADPPWRYKSTLPGHTRGARRGPGNPRGRSAVPYPTMTVAEIAALPVGGLAAADAHLYLWTTSTHLEHAWSIARGWGFGYSTLLVWSKKPRGYVGFGAFTVTTEFVLFCRRGTLPAIGRLDRTCWEWPRGEHSQKPEHFIDLVEQVSPGPYLELFSRRHRLGWDVWGNEVGSTVELVG